MPSTRAHRRLRAARVVAGALTVLVLAGCTASSDAEPGSSPSPAVETYEPVKVEAPPRQRLPADWGKAAWARVPGVGSGAPRTAPTADAVLPSVLDDPAPAALVHHPVERWEDPGGWGGERLLFLGRDGAWRSLKMADLGLPEAWWPGSDTYGPGAVSASGRLWAGHTDAGVVVVDLTSGSVRHVDFPRTSPSVRYVAFIPGTETLSAYATNTPGRRYWTFHVEPGGQPEPVEYDASRTRFDTDGTPVELRTRGRALNMRRHEPAWVERVRVELPFPFLGGWSYGYFSTHDVAFQPSLEDSEAPSAVWVLDKRTAEPRARLRVPPNTALVGWDQQALVLLISNRHLVVWSPGSGRVRRLLELPGPYPRPGEWAAATVSLPAVGE